MTENERAFLDMIAWAELGPEILAQSDDGYNVLAGSLPGMVLTFSSYHRHPGVLLDMDGRAGGLQSTAAGRYQLLSRYWKPYCELLGLKNFSKEAQDRIAIQQIKERRALDLVASGNIVEAIGRCRNIWASFPGAGYGQREHALDNLLAAFTAAGGKMIKICAESRPPRSCSWF